MGLLKRRIGVAVWVLCGLLLVSGLLGYCTPLSGLDPAAGGSGAPAFSRFVFFLSTYGGTLMLLGAALILFCIFILPFLLDFHGAVLGGKRFMRNLPLTAFMIPGALCLLLFNYLPMPGIVLAFKNFVRVRRGTIVDSIVQSQWVGLKNFNFLTTDRALNAIRNTFLYNFGWILLSLVLSVAMAIALSHLRNRRAGRLYQTGIFMPYFLSWVIASYLLYALISHERGFFGRMMSVNMYQAPQYWPLVLTLSNLWKYLGYNSIVYSAAISGIDAELYEAATLDGASAWGKIRYITLPMLQPMMTIMTIMAMGRMASADFGLFFNLPMASGQLLSVTDVFDTYVFRMLTGGTSNMGISAAASLFQSTLGFILIFASNAVVRRLSPENALF